MPQPPEHTHKAPIDLTHGGFIGDACGQDTPCRPGLACLSLYGDGEGAYPGGMCTAVCPKGSCFDDPDYALSRCVDWPHESHPMCMIECDRHGQCARENYHCERLERADHDGRDYFCVPDEHAATTALGAISQSGRPTPPPGTTSLDDAIVQAAGLPIAFSKAPKARMTPEAADKTTGEAASKTKNAESNAHKNVDNVTHTAHEAAESPLPTGEETHDGSWSVLSIAIIAAVGLITLIAVLRTLTSGRLGGMLRSVRERTDEETPLERIRRTERTKHIRARDMGRAPDVRLERRRSPIRPLRNIVPEAVDAQENVPVITRKEAIARAKIAEPTEEEKAQRAKAKKAADAQRKSAQATNKTPAKGVRTRPRKAPKKPPTTPPAVPPAFSTDELRQFSAQNHTHSSEASPTDDAAAQAPETPKHHAADAHDPPIMTRATHGEDPARVQLWSRATAARTFRPATMGPLNAQLPGIKDMDKFVPPLPIDIVLQLLDQLLTYAETIRQRKGYDAIVYIETNPEHTWFFRGPEGAIRVQHVQDAFAKPKLAVDTMRRKGFSPHLKVEDAHLLSLVHLGRYLLGSASSEDVILSIDALSRASGRFSDEELRLVRYLLAPEEHAQLKHMATQRGRTGGGLMHASETPQAGGSETDVGVADAQYLPCPNCASSVLAGDLACRQCGTPLHPRPVYCAVCGTRNLLFADGRPQQCVNISCGETLAAGPVAAAAESARLAAVAGLLSGFEEFRPLKVRGDAERYAAKSHGREVEIWQLPTDRGNVLIEDERPHYGLSDLITLPHRSLEQSGVRFVIYDPPAAPKNPLHALGPGPLAERLLQLFDAFHEPGLRAPSLTIDNLAVSDAGEVQLLHGHVLRASTAATPRITDTRFMAPELTRQALATARSDLYTFAAIWAFAVGGMMPKAAPISKENDAFVGAPDLVIELVNQCLRETAADRPQSVRNVLTQLRRRRRLRDLV